MPRSFSRCDTDGDDGDEDGDSNNNIMDEKGSYSRKERKAEDSHFSCAENM